ncbi:MAG: alpha/beta hydrolase [Ilumatobacter sp.]
MSAKESIQQRLATAVLKLPAGALRKMAGEPTVIDGRTLDVRLQLAAAQSSDGPAMADLDPLAGRAAASAAFDQTNAPRVSGVATHDMTIDDAGLTVRVYRPARTGGLRPAVLFMHQGGFVVGDLDTCDTFCSKLAADLDAIVVSLAYRMGPEHLYPAPSEDADAAWAWMQGNGPVLGIDTARVVVCGDSAGGQMTAALCQRIRDAGGVQPTLQVMVYPLTDASAADGSMISCATAFPLDQRTMDWFFEHALPDGFDRSDPSLSPALADNVGGVPPAIVVTAGFDPLRDQGMAFATALRAAGVEVTDRCEDSLTHSFLAFGAITPEARAATDRIIADIASHLA